MNEEGSVSLLLDTPRSTLHKYVGMKIYDAGSGAEARTVMSVFEPVHSPSPRRGLQIATVSYPPDQELRTERTQKAILLFQKSKLEQISARNAGPSPGPSMNTGRIGTV